MAQWTVGRAVYLNIVALEVNVLNCRISRASSGHDVAVPQRGTASTMNLGQRPAEASSGSVTPDRRTVGLEVSSIDGVTLSDGEGRENAREAAVRYAQAVPNVIINCAPELVICSSLDGVATAL